MVKIKPKTLFSKIPTTLFNAKNDDSENQKMSYWLEKLHIQGEKVRVDNNRREEQTREDLKDVPSENESGMDNEELAQLGINAQTKRAAAKNEKDRQKVDDLVRKSNRLIVSISSAFPWSLFPSTINVEESRVTFKFNQLISSQSHSVEISDISNVFIDSSLFFATLQVVSRTYTQNDIKIGHLNKKKAMQVKRVIEGLRTFKEHNINTSDYEIDELISKIGEFHTTR